MSNELAPPPEPAGQALLFSHEIELAETARRKEGRYTADQLREERPGVARAIAEYLGKGWGCLRLAQEFGVHHRTVAAVRDAMAQTVDEERDLAVRNLRLAGHLQVERLVEHPTCVPMQFAGPAAKQLLELAEVMDGRASSRTEHVERVDIFTDFLTFVQTLRSEKELGPGQVLEIEGPAMGFAGEKKSAFSGGDRGDLVDQAVDRESAGVTSEATDNLTAFTPASASDPAADRPKADEGGGGGRVQPPGAEGGPIAASQKFSGP